jgi:hypothetical protein
MSGMARPGEREIKIDGPKTGRKLLALSFETAAAEIGLKFQGTKMKILIDRVRKQL